MNILFCSAGRRVELLKDIKKSMNGDGKVVVTDCSPLAPCIYVADKYYLVSKITADNYIDEIINICKTESIDVVTTLIDPEIEILAKNKEKFSEYGIILLVPEKETAKICYDKFLFFNYLKNRGVNTIKTWNDIESFKNALNNAEVFFPVFVKPRTGSGSVGAEKIETLDHLELAVNSNPSLIIQEYMGDAVDLDADVYIDLVSCKPVAIFSKRKLESKIGGASKTISFIDYKLIDFIKEIVSMFEFYGAIDMDFFYKNEQYFLSEINPRFGGAYIHAYESGVDFFQLIENNVSGISNHERFCDYEEGVVMMMYDSLIVQKIRIEDEKNECL